MLVNLVAVVAVHFLLLLHYAHFCTDGISDDNDKEDDVFRQTIGHWIN